MWELQRHAVLQAVAEVEHMLNPAEWLQAGLLWLQAGLLWLQAGLLWQVCYGCKQVCWTAELQTPDQAM